MGDTDSPLRAADHAIARDISVAPGGAAQKPPLTETLELSQKSGRSTALQASISLPGTKVDDSVDFFFDILARLYWTGLNYSTELCKYSARKCGLR